jgi:PAS domain S-box-containing protein
MAMGVEQSYLQTEFLNAPAVVTAILEECSAITDYRTLRDTLPRRLASVLRCRSVLLYQRVGETLQFASGTFDDKPGWSASLLAVAHINPIQLNSNLPEAAAWRLQHAVTAPANSPISRLVAVPLIYRQKAVGVLVAIRTKESNSGELDVPQIYNEKDTLLHSGSLAHRQPALPHYWSADEVQILEAVAGIVALLLENTRLLERDRERIHELSLLNSISSQMNSSLYEWERMQSIIIQRTREIAATDLCAVLRPSSHTLEPFSWLSPSLQEKLYQYFNSNTAPLVIERPGDGSTQAYLDYVPPTVKTFFAFPLLSSRTNNGTTRSSSRIASFRTAEVMNQQDGTGNKVLGIVVGAYHRPWKLRREEFVMLQVLASQASTALENTQLMAEVMEARNEARKLLRQVLEDQRLKELILESIPSGLITVNLDGQITTFNHAAQTVLGYTASEVLGLPLQMLFSLDVVRKVIASGQEQHKAVEVGDHNGQEIMLDMHVMPLRDDRNAQIGALLTFTDVTAMHRLEEEKRRLDRLASLGEMAASVAHEVRNPLASIKTSMQMLMDDLVSGVGEHLAFSSAMNLEAQESIAVVLKEVERLDSIVRDLLLFARPRQLHLVPCKLSVLSDHVLDIMQIQCADAGVEVHRLYHDVPPLRADIAQMEQVLFNLLTPAIQAMPEGGILTVSCHVVIGDTREPDARQWLEFSVSDTGVGITLDQRKHIFQPFFTTKAHGIGLGLPITRRLIEDHRGSIHVESQPGYGATFTLQLPIENWEEDEHFELP